jgi:RNA polymerase sigma factor (sigma-70 family)
MVHRTCLRILGNPQDAEDAAQATFMVFVSKARKLRRGVVLSGWLYRTAEWTSRRALRARARRARHEKEAIMEQSAERARAGTPPAEVEPILDGVLSRLSRGQQDVVVLRHLCGYSERETAARLGLTANAVAVRLSRAMAALRKRLQRKGVEMSGVALAGFLGAESSHAASGALVQSIQAVCSGQAAGSAGALLMKENIMRAMLWKKVEAAAAVVAALCIVGSVVWAANTGGSQEGLEGVREGQFFRETRNLPKHTGLEKSLPFAYYPSVNKLDVAIQLTDVLIGKAGGSVPAKVSVLVRDKRTGKRAAGGSVPLDRGGYGRSLIDLPDLPDGEYSVEYTIGQHKEISPKPFKRIHFAFEKTHHGVEHKVYPPFTPVKVNGASLEVVGRRYRLNGFCLFDSIESLGRELLAAPVRLVGTTADGRKIVFSRGTVSGKAVYEDEAAFRGSISSPEIKVESRALIGEDGCAEVKIKFLPGDTKTRIGSLKLVVPLKDKEMPLFHYIADNAMRLNYVGKTPRGGKIKWGYASWEKGWVPYRWKVEEPGSDDGVLITGANPIQWYNQHTWDHRPFIPYLWLGAEERGLAFFMENEKGYMTGDNYPGKLKKWKSLESPFYETSINRVVRRGGTVAIEVDIITGPCMLEGEREITLGFMATPGKPMEKEFRTRTFATGCGCVVCWGGWGCSSKYPDNHDWSIVDKIQEIRGRGEKGQWIEFLPGEEEWFKKKGAEVAKRWPGRKVFGNNDWLKTLMGNFVKLARSPKRWQQSGVYFEEHAHDVKMPEWEVFQDEWASAEFNRFQKKPANWGVFSPSYQDFACYTANEWLKRGISLYFDNTNPKRCYNIRFGPAYVGMYQDKRKGPSQISRYGISYFAQRRYYRRIWKLVQHWNRKGTLPHQVDFTVHMTNTYTVPFNTWATATLGIEAVAPQAGPDVPREPDVPFKWNKNYQLPWRPDLVRAGMAGRQVGAIPLVLGPLSGHDRHAGKFPNKVHNRNWAMERIHGVRQLWGTTCWPQYKPAEDALRAVGYGTDKAIEFNYWDEEPFVKVNDDDVKWMALVSKDRDAEVYGLLILQSYSIDPINAKITFPGAGSFVELLLPWGKGGKADYMQQAAIPTGEELKARNGRVQIDLPKHLPSRLYKVMLAGGRWPLELIKAMKRRTSARRPESSPPTTAEKSRPMPKMQAAPRDLTPETKAKRLYVLANNYLMNGADGMARSKLNELINSYPDTDYAKRGREKLRTLR